jgi:hypothetical protein
MAYASCCWQRCIQHRLDALQNQSSVTVCLLIQCWQQHWELPSHWHTYTAAHAHLLYQTNLHDCQAIIQQFQPSKAPQTSLPHPRPDPVPSHPCPSPLLLWSLNPLHFQATSGSQVISQIVPLIDCRRHVSLRGLPLPVVLACCGVQPCCCLISNTKQPCFCSSFDAPERLSTCTCWAAPLMLCMANMMTLTSHAQHILLIHRHTACSYCS